MTDDQLAEIKDELAEIKKLVHSTLEALYVLQRVEKMKAEGDAMSLKTAKESFDLMLGLLEAMRRRDN